VSLLTLGGTAPAATAAGNAPAAKACQKGGFAKVVRTDGSGFRDVGACVSYAAKGGVLEPVGVRDLKVDLFRRSGSTCWANFGFTGGVPNTPYTLVTRQVTTLTDSTNSIGIFTDATGSYAQTRFYERGGSVSYTVDGATTGLVPITC
jgi:hypothetical protein